MPPVVSHPPPPPPLSGHLRCISASSGTPMWPRRFPSDLPCRIGFRSIEFREIHCDQGQRILDRCADAPEKFTICIDRKGEKGGRLAHPSWTMSRLELITPVPGYVEAAMGGNTQRGSGEGATTEGTTVCGDSGKRGISLSNTGRRVNIVEKMNMTS